MPGHRQDIAAEQFQTTACLKGHAAVSEPSDTAALHGHHTSASALRQRGGGEASFAGSAPLPAARGLDTRADGGSNPRLEARNSGCLRANEPGIFLNWRTGSHTAPPSGCIARERAQPVILAGTNHSGSRNSGSIPLPANPA